MSKKLLADPKVAALIERRENAAVKATRKDILDNVKLLGESYDDDELMAPVVKRDRKKVLADVKKVVRGTHPLVATPEE
jgi:hypothetical protein